MSLRHVDLPAFYQAADRSSRAGQNAFLCATRVRLGGVLIAAIAGAFAWPVHGRAIDVAGLVAGLGFFCALLAELYLLRARPERSWYEGRAAAESAKTLAWRFAVGGNPFPIDLTRERETETTFLGQLDSLLPVLKNLDVTAIPDARQISDRMRALRLQPLVDRRNAYAAGRVDDQRSWYTKNALWNGRRASAWTGIMLSLELAGMVAAFVKMGGFISVDLLGIMGAAVAAAAAWSQAKQHGGLANAYSVTALELATLREKLQRPMVEDEWSRFIDDAEEAFSREHTLWKASRGVESL